MPIFPKTSQYIRAARLGHNLQLVGEFENSMKMTSEVEAGGLVMGPLDQNGQLTQPDGQPEPDMENSSRPVLLEQPESVGDPRHYKIYMPIFSYMLGMYLIIIGEKMS